MGRQQIPAEYGPLTSSDEAGFEQACIRARENLQRAVDLLLLHNAIHERDAVTDEQKRTCNYMVTVNSVVAWERFIRDLCLTAVRNDNHTEDLERRSGLAYLSSKNNDGPGYAAAMLGVVSNGLLPTRWRIRKPDLKWGRRLAFPKLLHGDDADLAKFTDWMISMRNGVAHGRLDLDQEWELLTDADGSEGKTLQTGSARAVFTLMMQMIDQTIRELAEVAQFEWPSRFWLPDRWLEGHGTDVLYRNRHDDLLWTYGPKTLR